MIGLGDHLLANTKLGSPWFWRKCTDAFGTRLCLCRRAMQDRFRSCIHALFRSKQLDPLSVACMWSRAPQASKYCTLS